MPGNQTKLTKMLTVIANIGIIIDLYPKGNPKITLVAAVYEATNGVPENPSGGRWVREVEKKINLLCCSIGIPLTTCQNQII
jgi:hypothetical protein